MNGHQGGRRGRDEGLRDWRWHMSAMGVTSGADNE